MRVKKTLILGIFAFGFFGGVALGVLGAGELRSPAVGDDEDEPSQKLTKRRAAQGPHRVRRVRLKPDPRFSSPVLARRSPSGEFAKLQGRVVDRQGEPLSGVQAALYLPASALLDRPQRESPAKSDYVRQFLKRKGQSSVVVSDEDGRFELPQLTERSDWVALSKEGYVFQEKSPSEAKAGLREFVGYSLKELEGSQSELSEDAGEDEVTVDFEVLDPSGKALDQAMVHWDSDDVSDNLDWKPDNASASMPPGKYSVYATLNDSDGLVQSSKRTLFVKAGDDARSLSLTIDTVSDDVEGHVLVLRFLGRARVKPSDDDEEEDEDLYAVLIPHLGIELDNALLSQQYRDNYQSADDLKCLKDLDRGPYTLLVGRGRGDFDLKQKIVIENKLTFVDVTLPKQVKNPLTARAYGPDGQLLNDLSFSFSVSRADWEESYDLVSRGANGAYKIQVPHFSQDRDAPRAQDHILVYSEKYGSLSKPYQSGQQEMTFQFQEVRTHTITISGFQNCGVVGPLTVRSGGKQLVLRQGSEDRQILKVNEGQDDSTYIYIYVNNERRESRAIYSMDVEFTGQENHTEIVLPKLYPLTLQTDFAAGTEVTLEAIGSLEDTFSDNVWGNVDGKGRAQFINLPAGQYKVEVRDVEMVVTVPAPGPIKLESKAPNSLEIKLQGGGYLASRGFKNGDIIVGLGGRRYTNIDFLELIEGLTTSSERFLVERQGREIEIVADPSKLVSLQSHLGGELREARH